MFGESNIVFGHMTNRLTNEAKTYKWNAAKF